MTTYTVQQLNWEAAEAINRHARLDLTGGFVPATDARNVRMLGAAYDTVAVLEIDDSESITEALETIFRLTNSIDAAWYESADERFVSKRPARSTSVGDVIRVGEELFLCAPMGFRNLES